MHSDLLSAPDHSNEDSLRTTQSNPKSLFIPDAQNPLYIQLIIDLNSIVETPPNYTAATTGALHPALIMNRTDSSENSPR